MKQRVLSGMRPTGKLHWGNYFGAIKNWVELQKDYTCYFMIADLHSLNEPYDPAIKYRQIIEQAADFIAVGLDPKKCVIFVQSQVHEHSELAIILSNVIPVSYLFRMTQFKEKSESKQDSVNSGLLYYPVLMASDILLYKPQYIPVGDDQTQHDLALWRAADVFEPLAKALQHGLTVVTRDTADYARARVPVFNPWVDKAP